MRRTPAELDKMRKAGRVVAEILERTRAAIKPGVTTLDLDLVSREVIERRGARSNFLNYHGFPATICTSPNDMIVHGIPGSYVLQEGDIISVDCGAIIEGYHGDAAYTAPVGTVSDAATRLMEVTRQSLWSSIDQLHEGNRLHEVGRAVQLVAEKAGFSVVRNYVGHGIGTAMHEQPSVPNYWPGTPGPKLKVGNVFAVEPMVNIGSSDTVELADGWSVVTRDGSLSAHFEHTIAVTEEGPEVFTRADV
jgi:methionyl aminopeptidase